MTTVLIRCDATVEIGCGHVGRCMALAQALQVRGGDVAFLCNPEAMDLCSELRRGAFPVHGVEPRREAAFFEGREKASLIVFDHYGLKAAEERRLRPFAHVLAAIDDAGLSDHDVDVLIDPMPGGDPARHARSAARSCDVRCGAEWLMLRREFSALRELSVHRRGRPKSVEKVLVAVGGTDPRGLLPAILNATAASGLSAQFDVVVGSGSPTLAAVEAMAREPERNIRLHVDSADVPQLMAEADMAIGAGGVMAWERCALGLPSVTLIIVDNQQDAAPFLTRTGASLVLDARKNLDVPALSDACAALAGDAAARAEMSRRASDVTDARGAERVADLLMARVRDAASATASPDSSAAG